MGDGREAAYTATELLSPLFNAIIMRVIDGFTYPVRTVLFVLDTTLFTWLYLFLILTLARRILQKIQSKGQESHLP